MAADKTTEFLNFPPPDRRVFMQSPPPEIFEISGDEEAPSSAGPIDFLPDVGGGGGKSVGGRIVYTPKSKYFKAPTIIIEGAAN